MESVAAAAFYLGLVALIYGIVRITTASIERRGRDVFGIIIVVLALALFAVAVTVFVHSPKSILPF